MTSTPEDGEFRQRQAGGDVEDDALIHDEIPSALRSAWGNRRRGEEQEDELPQFDQNDTTEEDQISDNLDEVDSVPRSTDAALPESEATEVDQPPSVDDSFSIPDDAPTAQGSGISTPASEALSSQPSLALRNATPPRRPFDLRFQSRLSSSSIIPPRASSPAFLHSRQSSLASLGVQSNASDVEESTAPWDVIRWTRMVKTTNQAFSEIGRRNFGSPTCLAVTDNLVIGTSRGVVLVFDHHQNLKAMIGSGTKALEYGAVTSLAISADHTTVAAGHATGHIFTWEISRSSRPFLHIPPIDGSQFENRKSDGHVSDSTILHIGFLGFRRTALVSADDRGMAFSHLASRGTGSLGRTVKTTRILGRYPDLVVRTSKPVRKSSVLAFSPLPLGNIEQKTDSMGLVAMLTPYLLVIVSTTPVAQTQHKAARPKEVSAHSAMTAALAWFPAIKLKGTETEASRSKLVYAWSDVLTVLDIHEIFDKDDDEGDKPSELRFVSRSKYKAEEAIVAVQWLSRSVIAVLTITQQLLIVEDVTMRVTDSFDLLPKDIYHADVFSQQLRAVIENLDEEDTSMHGVVADAFHMSFRAYKGRLFLLGFKNMWGGSLTNWADRLIAMMDTNDFIGAIRLATDYYLGVGDKLTIGLPEDGDQRAGLVREKLVGMIAASLKYAFGKNQIAQTHELDTQQLKELVAACIAACLSLRDEDFLFDEVFGWYDDHGHGNIFVDVLEPYILDGTIKSLPPPVIKILISHFRTTHTSSKLEEIICMLDPTSMDIDQVTNLCKQNNLYEAYIYVWNSALQDYSGPLKELIEMSSRNVMVNGHRPGETTMLETPQKMFAYISFILTGRVYPTGVMMEEFLAEGAKLQIYRFLFSGSSQGQSQDGTLSESYPDLRKILTYDTAKFMSALNEAFEDSFLNDDEVMNGSIGDHNHVKIYTRRYIVHILLAVMSSGFDAHDSIYLDMFIGRNLPKYPQYMQLTGTDLQDTFMRLCHYDDEQLRDDAQLSVEYLLTAYHPPDIIKLVPVLQRAQFYRVLKSMFRQEGRYADLLDTYFQDPDDKMEVFEVLRELLRQGTSLSKEQQTGVAVVAQKRASDMLDIDVSSTALAVEATLPSFHSVFIDALEGNTWRQFRYLRVLIEPDQYTVLAHHLSGEMLELYIRLMCQHDPDHVVEFVKNVKEDDLRLESVLSTMELSGIIDAAVILLARHGQVRDAMDRLLKHIEKLQTALRGIVQTIEESPDQDVTQEAIDHLLNSVDRYTGVGIWICRGLKPKSAAKSPKRSTAQQPLTFDEMMWLDLINCVVDAARDVGSEVASERMPDDRIQVSLRTVVQKVFTALLSITTSREGTRAGNDFAFLRILRSFLTRVAETSPTLSELRGVIASIFSAYAYEGSLLALSNSMLDKDLFVQVDEVTQLRQQGWRPRGQICEICRRRVWGPGSGLKIWEAWERSEEKRRATSVFVHEQTESFEEESGSRGKGKATALATPASTIEEQRSSTDAKNELGPLVVFSCRHLYHKLCLVEQNGLDSTDSSAGPRVPPDHVQLTCPSCP